MENLPPLNSIESTSRLPERRFSETMKMPQLNIVNSDQTGLEKVTGYCFIFGKARDNMTGEQAAQALRFKEINLNLPPPFQKATRGIGFPHHGVIKINNIPFTVTMQEVKHFISRITPHKILEPHISGYPIHVIMEKPTGKTMDCFVEFPSVELANDCISRFEGVVHTPKSKLGTRIVNIDMSDQGELREALFPRARLIKWDKWTGSPTLLPNDTDPSWTEGFRGYFTVEEIFGLTRFAENPSRSPFAFKCQQRVYESMISTLYKFPWAATKTYTIGARDMLFTAVIQQLHVLVRKVGPQSNSNIQSTNIHDLYRNETFQNNEREVGLSQRLLMDLLFAALNAHGFSQLQKYAIKEATGTYGEGVNLSIFASNWPFQTLHPLPDISDDVTKFYLELFDTGYDLISSAGLTKATTYEKYCQIHRNKVGFPVVQWTPTGIELSFEDAMNIELALITMYIERGRTQWCLERGVTSLPLTVLTPNELLTQENQITRSTSKPGVFSQRTQPSQLYLHANDNDEMTEFQQALLADVKSMNLHSSKPEALGGKGACGDLDPSSTSFQPSATVNSFTSTFKPQPIQQAPVTTVQPEHTIDFELKGDSLHHLGLGSNLPQVGREQNNALNTQVEPKLATGTFGWTQRAFQADQNTNNPIFTGGTILADPFTDHSYDFNYLQPSAGRLGLQNSPTKRDRSNSILSSYSSPIQRSDYDDDRNRTRTEHESYGKDMMSKPPSSSIHGHSRSLPASAHFSPPNLRGSKQVTGIPSSASFGSLNEPDFGAIGTGISPSTVHTLRSNCRIHAATKPSKVVQVNDTIHEEDDKGSTHNDVNNTPENTPYHHRVRARRVSSVGQPGPAITESEASTDAFLPQQASETPTRLSARSLWNQVNLTGSGAALRSDSIVSTPIRNIRVGHKRSAAIPICRPPSAGDTRRGTEETSSEEGTAEKGKPNVEAKEGESAD